MAVSNKLSGGRTWFDQSRIRIYITWEDSRSQMRKLPFQRMLSSPYHEEDDCSQLFLRIIIVSIFTNFFNKAISKQTNSKSSPGTRSWSAAIPATTKHRYVCGSFYFPTNYRRQNIASFPTENRLVCSSLKIFWKLSNFIPSKQTVYCESGNVTRSFVFHSRGFVLAFRLIST